MNSPFSPLERELITDFLRGQGSSVRIRWNGGQLLLEKERCRFTGSGIIFSSPEITPPGDVTVELYFRKRGIWFISSCRRSGGACEIPIPAELYKMDDGDGGKPSGSIVITGTAETAGNTIAFQTGDFFLARTPPWRRVPGAPQFAALLSELVSAPFPPSEKAEVLPLSSPRIPAPLRKQLSAGLILYNGYDGLVPGEFSLYPLLSRIDGAFDIAIPLSPRDTPPGTGMQVLCCVLNRECPPAAAMGAINHLIHRIAAAACLSSKREQGFAVEGRRTPPELVFLDDSAMLIGGEAGILPGIVPGSMPGGTLFHTEITAPGRIIRSAAAASSEYILAGSRMLTLEFRNIPEEDRRFLFENCYGKKYTGMKQSPRISIS